MKLVIFLVCISISCFSQGWMPATLPYYDTTFIDRRGRTVTYGSKDFSYMEILYSNYQVHAWFSNNYNSTMKEYTWVPCFCERGGIPFNPRVLPYEDYSDWRYMYNYQKFNTNIQNFINYKYNSNWNGQQTMANIFSDYFTHGFYLDFKDVSDKIYGNNYKRIKRDTTQYKELSARFRAKNFFFEVTIKDTNRRFALVDTFRVLKHEIEKESLVEMSPAEIAWTKAQIASVKVLVCTDGYLQSADTRSGEAFIVSGSATLDQNMTHLFPLTGIARREDYSNSMWYYAAKARLFYEADLKEDNFKCVKKEEDSLWFTDGDYLVKFVFLKEESARLKYDRLKSIELVK